MTTHVFHADVHAIGLIDDCPRCEEHADDPQLSLDADMLAELQRRISEDRRPRSHAEGRAMNALKGIS